MRLPQSWSRARATLVLTLLTAAAWLVTVMLGLERWAVHHGGFVSGRVGLEAVGWMPVWLAPLTATLVHAGAIHLLFNLVILVFCGRPTEHVLGPLGLLILYLVGAYAAAAAHYWVEPGDMTPMVGASGAISAVLGAYSILFGRNKVKVASPRLALWLNALWLMAAWVILQLVVGFGFSEGGVQIAIAAHIGGFLAGVVMAAPLLRLRYRNA